MPHSISLIRSCDFDKTTAALDALLAARAHAPAEHQAARQQPDSAINNLRLPIAVAIRMF